MTIARRRRFHRFRLPNSAAERRYSLAQRGSAGKSETRASSASGAAQFLLIALALVFSIAAPLLHAADSDVPSVRLNADNTAGRPLEELTKKAVMRDYASAWRTLAEALNNNNPWVLDRDFVGIAQEKLEHLVAAQSKAGVRTRYVDRGHQVEVLFYSPEGSSIQVRDTAHLEVQVFDGNKLVHSEQVTMRYISLLTPTEVRWKVRLLQEIPSE